MARVKNTWWQRNKFTFNGLIVIFCGYFFYQSINPKFPPIWPAKDVGQFNISVMPFDLEPPYIHHGVYTKDFFLLFNQGKVDNIRQAYMNIGQEPLPLMDFEQGEDGILHGSQHGQEVHAIAPETITKSDKLWLTIQNWNGEVTITYWKIPDEITKA